MSERNSPPPGHDYRRRPARRTSSPARDRLRRSNTPEEQLLATGVRWDVERVDVDRVSPSGTDRARRRFRAALPDLIWNTAALEGNTVTLPEVRTLLDGVTIGGRPLEDQEQVLALSDAYHRLDTLVADGTFAVTKQVSDDLHRRLAAREALEAGHFRGEGSAREGGNVRLANGGTVPGVEAGEGGRHLVDRFDRTTRLLAALDDPRERALAYFAAATRSQFYFDGNKRTARLMMSGELMRCGFDAVNIPFARAYEFNTALDTLFETDDATTLMSFVADCA